jgi:hypothetical protein
MGMIQITPQMRVLVAIAAADFRRGIDGLAQLCRGTLSLDPFSGTVFVFRNRRATAVKILVYDGQGFWLCHKRLSKGKFRWWPSSVASGLRGYHFHRNHRVPGAHPVARGRIFAVPVGA